MIVFLTVYLGLIAGRQPVELKVDPAVKTIRLLLDGTKIETMIAPPWRTIVDFGPGLHPREIVAVGFNEKGEEIARASQIINVPRPTAEVDIAIHLDTNRVALAMRHIGYEEVKTAALKLDDRPLPLDRRHEATLPRVDLTRPHFLSAEVHFADGAIARREIAFGGQFGETLPAQLTPVALVQTGVSDLPPADGCLTSHGTPLHVSAVEKSNPLLIVVRDPDPGELRGELFSTALIRDTIRQEVMRRAGALDPGTSMRLLMSIPTRAHAADQPVAVLFPPAPDVDASEGGLFWLLTGAKLKHLPSGPRQWADAVAVAGVQAVASGRRRAVLLVLGTAMDQSGQSAASVRKYLAELGVPLFVWSATGPRPDLAGSWGAIEDVSSLEKMKDAAAKIRATLETQRIAWVDADPITALHAEVSKDCRYQPIPTESSHF